MNDSVIREGLKQGFLDRYYKCPEALVIEELGLNYGASRIDIAVVTDEILGFELKSDLDTLTRLPRQVQHYNAVFNEVTLVVAYTHAYEALKIIPHWWGVVFVESDTNNSIQFSLAREPRENPKPDKVAIAKLLWRDEALQLLEETGNAIGFHSKSRGEICNELASKLEVRVVRAGVCKRLKERLSWRSEKLQPPCVYLFQPVSM